MRYGKTFYSTDLPLLKPELLKKKNKSVIGRLLCLPVMNINL